ncbi:MAG: hypothetical protein O7D30_03700, partial [Rickettsia endosymbiont of Ixodes persulcatus]|nr:hypothetical protein [Rickettsia endosymbiont of Ixodes persulcatus]
MKSVSAAPPELRPNQQHWLNVYRREGAAVKCSSAYITTFHTTHSLSDMDENERKARHYRVGGKKMCDFKARRSFAERTLGAVFRVNTESYTRQRILSVTLAVFFYYRTASIWAFRLCPI